MPFDPKDVDTFDVHTVPTLNMVIRDISSAASSRQGLASLEVPTNVFKRFLKKIEAENLKGAKEAQGKDH